MNISELKSNEISGVNGGFWLHFFGGTVGAGLGTAFIASEDEEKNAFIGSFKEILAAKKLDREALGHSTENIKLLFTEVFLITTAVTAATLASFGYSSMAAARGVERKIDARLGRNSTATN
jgi:hypothetical protein